MRPVDKKDMDSARCREWLGKESASTLRNDYTSYEPVVAQVSPIRHPAYHIPCIYCQLHTQTHDMKTKDTARDRMIHLAQGSSHPWHPRSIPAPASSQVTPFPTYHYTLPISSRFDPVPKRLISREQDRRLSRLNSPEEPSHSSYPTWTLSPCKNPCRGRP